MARREPLQTLLEEIHTAANGNDNVYFQPPENFKMEYPCIRYSRDNAYRASADNHGYIYSPRYQLILISRDPDNPVVEKIARLPLANALRSYEANGLHHDIFQLYFS